MSKRCRYCRRIKSYSEFWLDERGVYSARCKACHGLAQRTCRQCGALFEGAASQKFCSETCRKIVRPQTFRDCLNCEKRFGPVKHLRIKFCSKKCAYAHRSALPKKPRAEPTAAARRAQSHVAYLIKTGKLTRPMRCECGAGGKIEAAHADYQKPDVVRWLCVRCHRAWDRTEPKGGVYSEQKKGRLEAAP